MSFKIKDLLLLSLSVFMIAGCSSANENTINNTSVTSLSANNNFVVKPVEFKSGNGQIEFSGLKNPVLMYFSKGEQDKRTKVNYQVSATKLNDSIPVINENSTEKTINEKEKSINKVVNPKFIANKSSVSKKDYKVGDIEKFWLETDSTGAGRFVQHDFKLTSVSPHLYIWVDQRDQKIIDFNAFPELVKYWEEVAYPKDTQTFGSPLLPDYDIDNDQHIYMLVTSTTGDSRAYFTTINMVPESQDEESHANKHKILVVGNTYLDPKKPDKGQLLATSIHEFQHLINFSQKGYLAYRKGKKPLWEESWIDEGMSVYAEQEGGFGLPGNEQGAINDVTYFLEKKSAVPIVTSGDSNGVDYAASYLFITYLADRFGKDILKKLAAVDKTGMPAVEKTTGKKFEEVFADWGISLYASGLSPDAKYNFKTINLHKKYGEHQFQGIKPQIKIETYPTNRQNTGYNWTLHYVALNNKSDNTIVKLKAPDSPNNIIAFVMGEKK